MNDEQFAALKRLWQIANGGSGQCRYVASFLLGLYSGQRFPFDLTNLRALDTEIVQDCLTVLVMDASRSAAEVHSLLGVPSERFEQLAEDWGIKECEV